MPKLLAELLSLPTAAFVEHAVLHAIEKTCRKLPGVTLKYDAQGNLLARYRHQPPKAAPLTFTAHTDHPGFCALRMQKDGQLLAAFRGWVEPDYFAGTRVRFWSRDQWVKGRVIKISKLAPIYGMIGRTGRPEQVLVEIARPVEPNSPGMWDLPDPELKDGLVHARGCDDIAGAAALLQLLVRLSERRAAADVYALFTRAEEVGFVGAIAAARAKTIPLKSPVIAIETSKALANAPIGDGPILRVGDKTSIFTPALTAFCERVAKELAQRDGSFTFQRKLMDGGTCESTAYLAYGYQATGLCVALGHYHNMDTKRKRIASEHISLSDWERLVNWFEALVLDKSGHQPGPDPALRKTLDERFESYLPLLQPQET